MRRSGWSALKITNCGLRSTGLLVKLRALSVRFRSKRSPPLSDEIAGRSSFRANGKVDILDEGTFASLETGDVLKNFTSPIPALDQCSRASLLSSALVRQGQAVHAHSVPCPWP